ncbi:hypothetical protein ABIE50_005785 [Chitinophaga sp. OAE865]
MDKELACKGISILQIHPNFFHIIILFLPAGDFNISRTDKKGFVTMLDVNLYVPAYLTSGTRSGRATSTL